MIALSRSNLWHYGLFGLPLALVALPIYVYVPQFYASQLGLSLAMIGAILLFARVLDAFIDPLIGVWLDTQQRGYAHAIVLSLPLLVLGFVALFHPPAVFGMQAMAWFLASLVVVYLGFSLASITYQSWGAALTQSREQRASLTAVREVCALLGVIIAAALPSITSISMLSALFVSSLLIAAYFLLRRAPQVTPIRNQGVGVAGLLRPLNNVSFRWLFAVFMLNGIAAAIPATLFLFFTQDRLLLAPYAGGFLILYFLAAALAMPLWVAIAKRKGEKQAWLLAMWLAIASFAWAYFLGAGDITGFATICILSGAALAADLALPPALLAALIGQAKHVGKHEGAYFGLWNWATKLNLALAAGISLPLLQWLGYQNGTTDEVGLHALAVGYALLPCVLKLCAALLLWRAPLNGI